jgi:hypothetical protein
VCLLCGTNCVFTYKYTHGNKPNTDVTTFRKCQCCLYADWLTGKRTFEEVSWTAGWLPLKVTQSSRGRHARRILSACNHWICRQSWFPFTEWSFLETDGHCNPCHWLLHLQLDVLFIWIFDTPSARLYPSLPNYLLLLLLTAGELSLGGSSQYSGADRQTDRQNG